MGKTITSAELSRLAASGAVVRREPMIIPGLDALIAKLDGLISKPDAPVDNSEVLQAIRELTAAVGSSRLDIDFAPVAAALKPREQSAYRFDIERNSRGQMTNVVATPMEYE